MGYLNETGLATLVGKVKGQVVQLTSAEYQQIPAETKNYDNKLYLVEDEAYAYPVDNEPTLNSKNLVKSGGVYKYTSKVGTGTLTTTAKTLIPAVNELYNSLSNKFRVVTSGSLRDIKNAGIYYLTSGVTDKPVNSGGIYYCGFYGDTVYGGIFAPTYEGTATQLYLTFTNNGSTWNTYSISTKKFETVTVTGTTTTSGAIEIPTGDRSKTLVNAVLTSQSGFVFRRDNGYFTVADNSLNPLANTQVTIQATWMY